MRILWLSLLIGCMSEVEVPPDVAHPKRISGKGYTVAYPGNWEVRKREPDYDKDHHIRLQSPGGCNVLIEIHTPPIKLRPRLQKIATLKTLTLKDPQIVPIKQWGTNNGHGVILTGQPEPEDPTDFPQYTVFGAEYTHLTYTITEECRGKLRPIAEPGLKLIANTFDTL